MERLEFLRRQNVDKGLLEGVEEFCHVYAEQEKETDRLQKHRQMKQRKSLRIRL